MTWPEFNHSNYCLFTYQAICNFFESINFLGRKYLFSESLQLKRFTIYGDHFLPKIKNRQPTEINESHQRKASASASRLNSFSLTLQIYTSQPIIYMKKQKYQKIAELANLFHSSKISEHLVK